LERAEVTDPTNGNIHLGDVNVRISGAWNAVIPNIVTQPCSVDVTFHGQTGVKVISGGANCGN
jgi:hypothetical protein